LGFITRVDNVGGSKCEDIRSKYLALDEFQKEAIGQFIEKGILLASVGIVDLYAAFIKVSKRGKNRQALELYNAFTKQVSTDFHDSSLPEIITSAILNFEI